MPRLDYFGDLFQISEMSIICLVALIQCLRFWTSVRGEINDHGEIVFQNYLRWNYRYVNPTCTSANGGRNPCQDIRICNFAAASIAMGGWPTLCGWVGEGVPKVCCGLPLVLGSGLMKKVDEEISRRRECGTTIYSSKSETVNKFFQILKSLPQVDISDPNKFDPPLDVENKPMLIPPAVYTGSRQGDFPWMVSIRKNGSHVCGGNLIDRKHILTAAHCVSGKEDEYSVHVGNLYVDDGYAFYVSNIAIHPQYQKGNYKNLAILTLRDEILSPNVPHICLSGGKSKEMDFQGLNTTLLRWGKVLQNGTSRLILRIMDGLTVVPNEECRGSYTSRSYINEEVIPEELLDDFICTKKADDDKKLCEEDYGGPLMYKNNFENQNNPALPWTLIGVDTFGPMCDSTKRLRLYTRVSSHLDWILKTTNE